VSPSPRWSECSEVPLLAALAAAQHDAWLAPAEQRDRVFSERVRQLVGHERFDSVIGLSTQLFALQPAAPRGWADPPRSAYFKICPRCQACRRTPHTIPQKGRIELAVLRDRDWLARQFERGRTQRAVAEQLGCDQVLVSYWADKHGLRTERAERRQEYESRIPAMHARKLGPGEIARELETSVATVRRVLHRLGLANRKTGQVYHDPAWWVERVERRGWTLTQCAGAAGITRHNASYYITKFGLSHITAARAHRRGVPRPPKYPPLRDPSQLAELLVRHRTYAAVATVIGCSPTLVSKAARALLDVGPRHRNVVPHSAPSWWTSRLAHGATTWSLAEEAGVSEKTARERLRRLGDQYLAQGYRNNAAAERARRRAS
jgi:hypothetical protein